MPIKHAFTSSKPDGTDPTQVQASHWNADHTGNLTEAEITGLVTDLAAKADKAAVSGATKTKITYNAQGIVTAGADATAGDVGAIPVTEKGAASGVATLDATTKLPGTQLPAHAHAEGDVTNLVTDLAAKEATANKNIASGYAPLDASAKLPAANLPTYTHPTSFVFADFISSDSAAFGAIGSPSGNTGYIGGALMDANHPGTVHIESGTVPGAGEFVYIYANYSVGGLASDPLWRWESAIQLSTLTNAKFRAGVFTAHNANPPTAGHFFEYDSAASPNWRAITKSSGTNDIDTLVPASAGAWIVLRMEGDATSTRFYINGSLVATSTLNRTDSGLRIVWQAIANSTSNVILDADYLIWFRNVSR